MSSTLTLEQRVARLEKLFSFSNDLTSLSLSNGRNSVTIGAGIDSAFLSVAGKNNLVALHSEDAFSVVSLYNKNRGEKPVLAFLVTEDGEGRVQALDVDGNEVSTTFAITESEDEEVNVRNRMDATHRPMG